MIQSLLKLGKRAGKVIYTRLVQGHTFVLDMITFDQAHRIWKKQVENLRDRITTEGLPRPNK